MLFYVLSTLAPLTIFDSLPPNFYVYSSVVRLLYNSQLIMDFELVMFHISVVGIIQTILMGSVMTWFLGLICSLPQLVWD